MSTNPHIVAPDELMAYLDGELSADRTAVIRAHVETCAECQRAAAELQHVSDELRGWEVEAAPETLRSPAMPAGRPRSRFAIAAWPAGPRYAAAAALSIVAAGSVMWVAEFEPPHALSAPKVAPQATEPTTIARGGGAGGTASGRSDALADSVRQRLAELRGRVEEDPAARPVASARPAPGGAAYAGQPETAPAQAEAGGSKIARTVSLTIVTKDVAAVRPAIDALLRDLGGFVGTIQASGEGNTASLHATLRIPFQRLDAAITAVRALGRVIDETQTGEDVGEQVRDLGARLANSRSTEKRLTEVLRTRTGRVSDVLEVEREIARVREEIERMDAERAHLERRVAYATITLSVQQERQATLDMGPLPLSTQFRNALVDGLGHAFESIVDVALSLLHTAPFLLMWVLLLWWPVRVAVRRSRGWLRPAS